MKFLQVPEQLGAPNVGKAKHRLANLSSLIGLSAGALGWSGLAHAGDVDNDGRGDILIGTYQDDPGGNLSAGSTYLISGHTLDLAADGTGVTTAGVIDMAADLGLE